MADNDDLPYIVVERRSSGIAPFIWGALVGAALGVLFAPRSGRETRREIREGARRIRDSAENAVRNVQETVSGTLEDLRGQVAERVESARRAMDAGREAARETRADLERRVHEAQKRYEAPALLEEDEFQS